MTKGLAPALVFGAVCRAATQEPFTLHAGLQGTWHLSIVFCAWAATVGPQDPLCVRIGREPKTFAVFLLNLFCWACVLLQRLLLELSPGPLLNRAVNT